MAYGISGRLKDLGRRIKHAELDFAGPITTKKERRLARWTEY